MILFCPTFVHFLINVDVAAWLICPSRCGHRKLSQNTKHGDDRNIQSFPLPTYLGDSVVINLQNVVFFNSVNFYEKHSKYHSKYLGHLTEQGLSTTLQLFGEKLIL